MYYYLPPSPNYPLEGNTKQVIRRTACQIPSMWRLSPTTLSQRHMDLHVWSYPLKSVLGFKNTRGVERCPFPIFLTFSTASVMTVWWWRRRTIYNLPISFPRRYANSTDSTVIMVHATSSSSSQPVAMTFHLRTHRVCAVRIRSVTFYKKVRYQTHDCNTTVSF